MRILIASVFMVVSGFSAQAEEKLMPWEVMKPWQAKALEHIKSLKAAKNKPTVMDAYWRDTRSNQLFVEREFDGSRQDEFAMFLCKSVKMVAPTNDELKSVYIYEPEQFGLKDEASGENMGTAVCR